MKKTVVLLLCFILLMSSALAEVTVVDLRAGEESLIAEDAETMDIYFPQINGCNGAVVVCGDTVIVIDACVFGQYPALKEVLNGLGITKIDYCINTHPDNDHIDGFFRIPNTYEVGTYITGFAEKDNREELQNKLYLQYTEAGIPWVRAANGDVIDLGDFTIRFIQRNDPQWEINNCSLSVMLTYKGRSAYFPGDIQKACQKVLQAEDDPDDISADLINWPHHGYSNMQAPFMEKVSATLYVITSGRSTANDAVKQLKEQGISTYYITEKGPLHFSTDGNVWQVEYMDW